ncbi:interleukin-7 receptor subunit alpha isoform X1 [Embiotoca jacksoni]|uniref:interleukin-7 receptor subunit alpha isoform X1 n=1 Tax=Embiotoca jacksoni TaxID=100190 RepID=UPI003703D641
MHPGVCFVVMDTGGRSFTLMFTFSVVVCSLTRCSTSCFLSESRISCTSDITTERCSLTCELLAARGPDQDDDDEDDEDGIEGMSLCYTQWESLAKTKCLQVSGATVSSEHLMPLMDLNLTVHLKRGGDISTAIDLSKIVKPRSPKVKNVTFDQQSQQAVIQIQTPYQNDFLKVENQMFQLHIFATGSSPGFEKIENLSAKDFLPVDLKHLHKNTEYRVKVRAIPLTFLPGTWSEWSETYSFCTPAGVQAQTGDSEAFILIVCFVSVVALASSVVVFWKNNHRIFSYMWPSIPHPKQTLVHICRPNKGLLLNLKPEVFSALRVDPLEKTTSEEPSTDDPDGRPWIDPGSTQSSDCRSTTSATTEELELSTLLSSSDGEDSLPSTSPSPVHVPPLEERPHTPERCAEGMEVEVFGGSQQEEAYVTMSSFYQIK